MTGIAAMIIGAFFFGYMSEDVTVPAHDSPRITVKLPRASNAVPRGLPVLIRIERGSVSCPGYRGTIDGLVRHCRRKYGSRYGAHFVLTAPADIPFGRVVAVLEALKKAGFLHIRLRVRK